MGYFIIIIFIPLLFLSFVAKQHKLNNKIDSFIVKTIVARKFYIVLSTVFNFV